MIHNGIHQYQTDYFEWWYFHFISDKNLYFSLILHPTDIFGENINPYFSVSLHTPNGQVYYFNEDLPIGFFNQCKDKIICQSDKISLIEFENYFRLSICLDDLKIEGDINRVLDKYVFNDGVLYNNQSSSKSNYWIVGMPLGNFDFKIRVFNEQFECQGVSYHDHNWGTAKIQDYFTSWIWGHLVFDEGFLLFYQVKTVDEIFINRGLLYYRNELKEFSSYKLTSYLEGVNLNTLNLPCIFDLEIQLPNQICSANVRSKNVFRKREDYKYQLFIPFYYRAQCAAEIKLNNNNYSSVGLIENLFIRRR